MGAFGTCIGAWVKVFSVSPDLFMVSFAGQSIVALSQVSFNGLEEEDLKTINLLPKSHLIPHFSAKIQMQIQLTVLHTAAKKYVSTWKSHLGDVSGWGKFNI